MHRPLGAQISHMLKNRGVDVIFGIPGVHNQEMYRGIEEAGITHVLARHEQGAGFMADGYARATGKPGVAYVITGPGLTNIMTPMGQAYSDSVPMLVISSCLEETAATHGQLHQMKDQRAAAETVCDWSAEARTADAAYALIDRALLEFETRRKRPKHVQVPSGTLEAMAPRPPKNTCANETFTLFRPDIDGAVDMLRDARRPVVVFGGGTFAAHAGQQTHRLVHRLGAVAFTTFAGRGLLSANTERFMGATLGRDAGKRLLQQADVVLAIGTELAEVDLWRRHLGHDCPLIRVDIDEVNLTAPGKADLPLLGNALDVMAQLVAAIDQPLQTEWTADDIARAKSAARAEVDAERPGIVPVCDALRDCLPKRTMIYSDMTQFAYAAKEVWDMDCPGHWHHPTGFGTLGYALPAAIGGAVARAGLPTLAIAGDYGFQYTMQELATAVELKLPLPIFLWDNGKLKEIEDSMIAVQIQPNAVTVQNPDFVKLAEAYGVFGHAPQNLADMQSAVAAAFEADRPTIIHVSADIALS